MIDRVDSEKKKKLIADFTKDVEIGESVEVAQKHLISECTYRPEDLITCIVKGKKENGLIEIEYEKYKEIKKAIVPFEHIVKSTHYIGANPFPSKIDRLRNVNFCLESIIDDILPRDRQNKYELVKGTKVEETNWNPFVFIDGEKKYYQRGFVWSLEDKQNLIDSIYNNVGCGKIIVRNRSWEEVERLVKSGVTEVAFKDIVDGKQRLGALIEFVNNVFPDSYGNYWSDLSNRAKHLFGQNQLFSYCYLGDDATDEDVIEQFLKTNFTGVPQSIEHIEYVKSLHNGFKQN